MKKTTTQKSKSNKKRENNEVTRGDSESTAKKVHIDKFDFVLLVI